MGELLNPDEVRELAESFVRALIEAPCDPKCGRYASDPLGACSCWRANAVAVYHKYVERARAAGKPPSTQDRPQ